MNQFSILSKKYDIYNSADFDEYAKFLTNLFIESSLDVHEVLDLGCGTGEISLRLSHAGYDMICVDISDDMLNEFKQKIKSENILLLQQDMCALDLFGTVQAAFSTFDCLNYLKTDDDLKRTLTSVSLFLEKDGLFIFDINTIFAYSQVYGTNSYVYEDGDDMLIWQNNFNKKTKKCYFDLTFFDRDGDRYRRLDETQVQTYFSPKTIEKILKECGFEVLFMYGGTDCCTFDDMCPKAHYVTKKIL
ncbi:MAG: class I SAM-dependent methyltransferase [Clostridia bacterium]